VDSEGRPVRFGYESDEEYEKRARPIMTDLQMKDVSSFRATPSKTRGFLSRLLNKPFKEYEEFDEREKELTRLKNKANAKTEEAPPIVRSIRGFAKGDKMKSTYKQGGKVSSASKRADGAAQRGKTRGKYI